MAAGKGISIGVLRAEEVGEAKRIFGVAFAKFLGLSSPDEFLAGQDLVTPRWRAKHVKAIAARDGGRLIGFNVVTRWGSFGFFGPLSVLPEYWGLGVGRQLVEATVKLFDRWGVTHSGLFTFPHSAKHVALYQKSGYWPCYLTAVMIGPPESKSGTLPTLMSTLGRNERKRAVDACARLTNKIYKGLDLGGEIQAVAVQGTGDVVLTYTRGVLDGFAVCVHGPGSEAGEKLCYLKFGAARSGAGAAERFDKLLEACEGFAQVRGVPLEAGMNLAREDAYHRMRARGYRATMQGVAMQRPHAAGFNRADAYVIDDWR